MYKYLVVGGGRCGRAVVYDLIEHCEASQVTIMDPNPEARVKCCSFFDAGDIYKNKILIVDFVDDLSEFDAILNCAPFSTNLHWSIRALQSKIPYFDLGGNNEVIHQQKITGNDSSLTSPIIPDCGIAPGIGNIITAGLIKSGYDNIRVYCGGITPTDHPKKYKMLFSKGGLISEYTGWNYSLYYGKIQKIKPIMVVGNHGEYEYSHTSNISEETVKFFQSLGCKHYTYATLRLPGHYRPLVNRDKQFLREYFEDETLMFEHGKDRDQLVLDFEVVNSLNDIMIQRIRFDCSDLFTAMEYSTACGITLPAYYYLKNGLKKQGFFLPESFVDHEFVIDELVKRGVKIEGSCF